VRDFFQAKEEELKGEVDQDVRIYRDGPVTSSNKQKEEKGMTKGDFVW
jgi:hypothetical protein